MCCVLCVGVLIRHIFCSLFFFQAEDGIRDLVRSRGLGDVYKRQVHQCQLAGHRGFERQRGDGVDQRIEPGRLARCGRCLLYTSDAADERSSVDLGGRRIIKKNRHGIYNR